MDNKLNRRAIKQMKKLINHPDIEVAHADADDILCELLKELGYTTLIDLYEDVEKWYA